MKVDVVRVEVVGDVGGAPGPRAKGLELVLGLRHVRVHVSKATHLADAVARVDVDRIKALVDLHHAQHPGLLRRLLQREVVSKGLHRGFGHKDVEPERERVLRWTMGRAWVGGRWGEERGREKTTEQSGANLPTSHSPWQS